MEKRDEILKEALCVLLAGHFAQDINDDAMLCDNEIINQYQQMVQRKIDALPGAYGKAFAELAYKLEDDPSAIGRNRSIAHALAVEIAVKTLNIPGAWEEQWP